jgi:hypothetical protein
MHELTTSNNSIYRASTNTFGATNTFTQALPNEQQRIAEQNDLRQRYYAHIQREEKRRTYRGIHNSQPVHKSVKMVCMSLPLPIIASTGQALIHLVL